MFSEVIEYMNQFYPVCRVREQMEKCFTRITIPKKTIICKSGDVCKNFFFIEKGLMRAYFEKDGEEVTTWVVREGMYVTAIQSIYSQMPSFENIETLEETTLVQVSFDDTINLAMKEHDFCKCMFMMFQRYNVIREIRGYVLRAFSAEERYKIMYEKDPDLFDRTPNKIMASYLNMSQETLSRVKSKLKKLRKTHEHEKESANLEE